MKKVPERLCVSVLSLLMSASVTFSPLLFSGGIYAADEEKTALEYYISPLGSDDAAGTVDAPFATIEKARNTVRELASKGDGLPDGGVTVYLRGGRYPVTSTISFTSADSGTADCPITYAAYGDEEVFIDGGVILSADKFTTPDDGMLSRITDPDAKANLLMYDMKSEGLDYSEVVHKGTHSAVLPDCRLYIDGERQWLGRYPDNAKENSYVYFEDADGNTYKDSAGRVKNWSEKSISEAKIYGTFQIDWIAASAEIEGYDADTGRVTYRGTNGYAEATSLGRYFYYNVPEEIDVPGEYYIDRDRGMLYLYMPDGYEDKQISFAQFKGDLIKVKADYITFEGITFENSVDNLLKVTGDHVTLKDCTFRCAGQKAISASDCSYFRLTDSEIYSIGRTGITNDRCGDINRLISSGNVIDNNNFHHFAELDRVYNNAVNIGNGCGYLVAHNEIWYGPHQGMGFSGLDISIEYNYFHDVCYESNDAGAIYTYGGGWGSGGLYIHDNIFENVINNSNIPGAPVSIYIDAASGCANIRSNLIVNSNGFGILTGGHGIEVRDNLLINSTIELHSAAYYKILDDYTAWAADENGPVSTFPLGMNWQSLLDPDRAPAFGAETWAYRYPWTMLIKTTNVYDLQDRFVGYAYGDGCMRQNITCGKSENLVTKTAGRLVNVRDNLYLSNTDALGLADWKSGDYRLTENTKIYHHIPGFKYCDVENVGITRK